MDKGIEIGEIRDYLVVITTVITILGIFIKTLNNLFLDLIKSKFDPVPAKQNLYDTVIKTVTSLVFAIELLFLVGIVIVSIFGQHIDSETVQQNSPLVYCIAWMLCGLIITTFVLAIYLLNKSEKILSNGYKKNVERENKTIKPSKNFKRGMRLTKLFLDKKKVLNFFNKLLSIITSAISLLILLFFIMENDYQNSVSLGVFFIISISIFIISNSLTPFIDVVNNKYNYYIVIKSNDVFISDFFLEFENSYLIIENGIQRYINKQEIKEIKKKIIINRN